jgi:hypothetical protein
MTEKGIVLKIHRGIAEIQLERAPGVSKGTPQIPLHAKCSLIISTLDEAHVRENI